jgi:agmatine/peptidylarginine deiminase
LGAYEERLLGDLKRKVGDAYEVVPVPARGALLQNGGVHCVFGVVRGELLAGPSD